jgi:outer membrane protein
MATARAIRLSPPWDFLTQMDLVHEERTDIQRQLSLATAVQEAVNANLDLQAAGHVVAAGKETIQEAQSVLLPQLDVAADASVIDADRAESAGGGFPERQFTGAINLFQMIYDEPSWANLSIQRDLQSGRQEERQLTLLDVVLEATTSYLHVLRAQTSERIQQQNLVLTRTNLELARVRRQIGVAREAEVLRWENQLANNRRTVINAFAQRQQAQIRLNRVLHRPLEEEFRTVEPTLDDPDLMTNFAKILPYVDNPRYFEIFRDFMVQEGLAAAPELRRADARIRAQERAVRSAQRSFWSPTLSLRGRLAGVERGGAGSDTRTVALGPGQTLEFPQDNAWNWEVGATASLPLFTGSGRRARRNQAREELAQLKVEREATAERVATRIRIALYQAGAAYANIDLAREAAAAAERNYELVRDAYRQGAMSILDLLDAQTESLNAKLDAATVVYIYLIDLMQAQRAVGQFDFFVSAAGRQAWFEKLDAFFRGSRE